MKQRADVVVVGAGILGLAAALGAARRGLKVVLLERDRLAQGASVRNFGMVWPIGQSAGELHDRALKSRQIWLELAAKAGIWHEQCGSLHLAYAADEWTVLQEFAAFAPEQGYHVHLYTPAQLAQRYPMVKVDGLRGGLWSPTELCVDPRQAIARLPEYMAEHFGIDCYFDRTVQRIDMPYVQTSDGQLWQAEHVVVASGTDFQTLFPEVFLNSGIRRCKLQMMRTLPQPGGWRMNVMIAGGLTLCHYPAFLLCPSLENLRVRIHQEMPDYVRYGIHVMAAQNHHGEVVIGDSHEYDHDISPFDKPEIDQLILSYLQQMIDLPTWQMGQRWHGIYAKHPTKPLFTAEPQPRVHIVTAPGGAGMTMAFGWLDDLWDTWLNPAPLAEEVRQAVWLAQ